MKDYEEFLRQKERTHPACGINVDGEIHSSLFPWQREVVRWALRKGRCCLFEDTGLGKTLQQLVWGSHIPGQVLLLAPLSVSEQTQREADRFGIDASISRNGEMKNGITITNYERIHKFDLSGLSGIILDEASIIKSKDGATRNAIIDGTRHIPFRLACTATPAPNDHQELGNQAEFVGAMSLTEMLATYFCHDGGDTSKWRLKGHAKQDFWRWVATWAMMIRTPADIGFEAEGYDLPNLKIHEYTIKTGIVQEGMIVTVAAQGLNDQRKARRETLDRRVEKVAEIVDKKPNEAWVVWAELNDEGDALELAIPGAAQVAGADDDDDKVQRLVGFANGTVQKLVTKPKIAGFGMNWQHCNNMAFVGLSNSWEQFYQAVRRCWRFGQTREVDVHIVSTDIERAVLDNIKRKQGEADTMASEMVQLMKTTMQNELGQTTRYVDVYERETVTGHNWTMHRGDCVEIVSEMPDDSIDYTVYSPPFSGLYVYSSSDRDMGNSRDDEEFFTHYRYLVRELFRVTRPGRLISFHCMDLPMTKEYNGVIGLRDFRGDLIRVHQEAGWVLHSQVVIWKDPVTAMQRTKALGLLHKQIKKDSAMSRQGIPDYLVTMRKDGVNTKPITHTGKGDDMPVELWQRYASPVWSDINPSNTLQFRSARENEDERHICPLQLQVISRAMEIWSTRDDLVLSPFAGIGSEGHVALKMNRRFVGCELKASYFKQAVGNLEAASNQLKMF